MSQQEESTQNLQKSCITDSPLLSATADDLKAADYADALANFIVNADTPVTIGIQGGWGSGKTSLITVLQEILESGEKGPILCVTVNAWEHSLFHSGDSKADVALSLLNGLAEGVQESVAGAAWLPDTVKKALGQNSETVEKAIHGIKLGVMFLGKVATQMLSNSVGGGDISNVKLKPGEVANIPSLAKNVRALKTGLEEMSKKISIAGKSVKVVFFIDDLDRVPPPTAVEVLDITKNIFNIPDCVFVLAIDYEVVVKGLEEKFGKKTPQNEREFRQYFDKIIQIPFTMPTGVYGDNVNRMLKTTFEHLNLNLGDIDQETLNNLAEDARWVTGGNPRSIKRIINTLSLLQHIAGAKAGKAGKDAQEGRQSLLEARFIIVSMYINYPEICRRLMEKPDFTEWNPEKLNLKWKLNLKENTPQLEALAGEDWCNDNWEKTIYCICSQSDWLKSQARNVSLLLNKLLKVLDPDNSPDKPLSEKSQELLQELLESIRVVSIDLDQHDTPVVDDKRVRTDRVSMFDQALQNELASRLPEIFPAATDEYAKKLELRPYAFDLIPEEWMAKFEFSKSEEEFYAVIELPNIVGKKKVVEDFLTEELDSHGEKYEIEDVSRNELSIFVRKKVSWDDFLTNAQINMSLVNKLADETMMLLNFAQMIEKKLEDM